jgi:perosamine synthetase
VTKIDRIPIAGPSIGEREIAYVTDAVTSAWYGHAQDYHRRFETAFADYLGVKHAVAMSSCTAAIHLSLAALGVGAGDEVVVPDITWIASAAPISYVGATPVFADIDPATWCLSAGSFADCITPHTKAVIPVDLYGNMPDMDAIRAVARSRGIAVIEDAAEAVGSMYGTRRAGALGDTGVFSFHGSKTLTTGEGGMLVTDRDDLFERLGVLAEHGREPSEPRLFWASEVAFKYKMSAMQAALGLAQLERVDELVARKREIFHWYGERLSSVTALTLNHEAPGTANSYWMVTVIVDPARGVQKETLMAALRDAGIDSRPFFYPLSSLPPYVTLHAAAQARSRNTVAYGLSPYGVNLPCALTITEEQVDYVCRTLRSVLGV